VKAPAEAVLDSRNLLLVADAASILARSLKINSTAFDTDEFVSRLANILRAGGSGASGARAQDSDEDDDDDDDDEQPELDLARWDAIGRIAAKSTYRVPAIDFMSVPLSPLTDYLREDDLTPPPILCLGYTYNRYGPLAIERKEKAPRQRAQRAKQQDAGPVVRPQEVLIFSSSVPQAVTLI
jgi:hypothetical protein